MRRKTLLEKQHEREILLERASAKLQTLTRRQLRKFLSAYRNTAEQPPAAQSAARENQ
jgi:hypothetical protein